HGVGGIHASTGARPGNGMTLDIFQPGIIQPASGMFAHGLKNADDVEILAIQPPRHDGAAVYVDGRDIGSQDAHHAAGHVLVAATDHQYTVHPLALHTGFHAVGNDLARHQ